MENQKFSVLPKINVAVNVNVYLLPSNAFPHTHSFYILTPFNVIFKLIYLKLIWNLIYIHWQSY